MLLHESAGHQTLIKQTREGDRSIVVFRASWNTLQFLVNNIILLGSLVNQNKKLTTLG